MKRSIYCSLATLGPIGHVRGSGTVATLLTLPAVYFLSKITLGWYLLILGLFSILAYKLIPYCLRYFGTDDPPQVVVDEVLGCLVTFIGIPGTWHTLVLGFLIFRFFDITKCCGIKKFGMIKGPLGVLLDDVAAGIVSNGIVHVLLLCDVI